MDTNKMREQFESAWRARYPDHGDIALKRSGLDPMDYCNTRVRDAWWAWQRSREAVVVELTSEYELPPTMDMQALVTSIRQQDIATIEAQGLRVAP